MTAIRRLEPVQWSAILGAIGVLLWSIPGLFVNPDFSTGHAATSKLVLGVDMNGWHAVSGFPLALGAFWFARRARDAAVYVPLAAGALIATGIWALLSTRPAAGLFYFPHNHGDAWLHFSVAAVFLAGLVHYLLTRQSGASIEYTTRWSRLPTTSAQSSSRSASVIGRRSRSASSSKRKPR